MAFVQSRVVPPLANTDCEAGQNFSMARMQSGEIDGVGIVVFLDEAADALELFAAAGAVNI